jgi:hypothetical protein
MIEVTVSDDRIRLTEVVPGHFSGFERTPFSQIEPEYAEQLIDNLQNAIERAKVWRLEQKHKRVWALEKQIDTLQQELVLANQDLEKALDEDSAPVPVR